MLSTTAVQLATAPDARLRLARVSRQVVGPTELGDIAMAAFEIEPKPVRAGQLPSPDYWLLRDTPLTRVADLDEMSKLEALLRGLRYRVESYDFSQYKSLSEFFDALTTDFDLLEREAYRITGLNGLSEAVRDFPMPESGGLAFQLLNFDAAVGADREAATAILDILANASWFHMLEGHRWCTLVHSTDQDLSERTYGGFYLNSNTARVALVQAARDPDEPL